MQVTIPTPEAIEEFKRALNRFMMSTGISLEDLLNRFLNFDENTN